MIWTETTNQIARGLPETHRICVNPRGDRDDDVFWSVHLEDENEDAGTHPDGGDSLILEVYGSAATIEAARCAAEQAYKRLCRISRAYRNMAGHAGLASSS